MSKDIDYKEFYEKNRIALLQYQSLRKNFNLLVENVLGEDYCNMAMDVYDADRICCEDIARKANRSVLSRLLTA
jgi:hypothetical protein